MKKILNNKKVYIGFIIILAIIYLFLIYGGIQKGITKTFQYEYDNSRPFIEDVMRPGKTVKTVFIYNIIIMVLSFIIQITFIIISNKKKLKIFILLLFVIVSLTLVPIRVVTNTWDGQKDPYESKYYSCIFNKEIELDYEDAKWPLFKDISYKGKTQYM